MPRPKKMTAAAAAAYDAMLAAELTYRADKTEENRAAYNQLAAAYNGIAPQLGNYMSHDMSPAARSGRRQHAEQAARTAEAMRRKWR